MAVSDKASDNAIQGENRSQQPTFSSRVRGLAFSREGILLIILALSVIILGSQSDLFLKPENLLNQGRFIAEVALVALPMTLIIIKGGIDLSVGSTFCFTAGEVLVFWGPN